MLKYEEALDTNPADERALTNIAEIGLLQLEGDQRAVAEIKFEWQDVRHSRAVALLPAILTRRASVQPRIQVIDMLFRRALSANSKDAYTLYRYARFLDKCDLATAAEEVGTMHTRTYVHT